MADLIRKCQRDDNDTISGGDAIISGSSNDDDNNDNVEHKSRSLNRMNVMDVLQRCIEVSYIHFSIILLDFP